MRARGAYYNTRKVCLIQCTWWWSLLFIEENVHLGEHEYLHQSLSLHGLDVRNLAIARQFKAYFPCTRAKPHLHERHNKTLWSVILNPDWQHLAGREGTVQHTPHMAPLHELYKHAFPWFNKHRFAKKSANCRASAKQAGTGVLLVLDCTHSWKLSI